MPFSSEPGADRPDGRASTTAVLSCASPWACSTVHRQKKCRDPRDVGHRVSLCCMAFSSFTFNNALAMAFCWRALLELSLVAVFRPCSGWFPRQYKGLAMGIAGAGNSGTAAGGGFAPRLATHYGWQHVYGFAAAMICCRCSPRIFRQGAPRH